MEDEIFEKRACDEIIDIILSNLSDDEIREKLGDYHNNDIAEALPELTVEQRQKLYRILGIELVSEIFTYLDDVSVYLEEIGVEKAADVIENMDADDAVDVLEEIEDEEKRDAIISLMEPEAAEDIRLIKSYEDDEIGSMMTTNYVVVSRNSDIKQAMRSMIEQAGENDNINTIYVVDEEEKYYGAIELRDLIIARTEVVLDDITSTAYPSLDAHEKISDVIEKLKDYAEDSIPVLDENNRIIGVITSTDIVEAIDSEMSDDYAKLAGLASEEELSESLGMSIKKRLPWLVLLLGLGILVSTVAGMFEEIVREVAVVVCFQSLILGMAGNVGTQSLAVTIRVLMDENISGKEKFLFVLKEMKVGFCNGFVLGLLSVLVAGLYMHFLKAADWGYAFSVSGCVGISIILAMVISSLMGTVIPMFFHKIKVDPAVASGPLISTVNDLVAVVTYYSMANLLLIQLLGI